MNKTSLLTVALLLGSTLAANQLGYCPTSDSYDGYDLPTTWSAKTMYVKFIDKGIERLLRYAERAAAMKGMSVSLDANYAACYAFTAAGSTTAGVTSVSISVPGYEDYAMDFEVTNNDDGEITFAYE